MSKWLRTTESITFEVRDRVAVITLNRPHKRNALTRPMLAELRLALLEADDLKAVHCIVLQGAGQDFCSGYDMVQNYDAQKQMTNNQLEDRQRRTVQQPQNVG